MTLSKEILRIEDLVVRFYTYEGVVEAIDGINLSLRERETLGLVGETGCGKSVTSLSAMILVPSPGKIEKGKVILRKDGKAVDLIKEKEAAMRNIRGDDMSMIFQDPRSALNPVYSVEDQIGEVFLHHRMKELSEKVLQNLEVDIKKAKGFRKSVLKFQRARYQKMAENPKALSLRLWSRIPIVNRYKGKLKNEVKKEVVRVLKAMKIPDPDRVAEMYPHELSGGMAQRVVIAMALGCNPEILIADEPTTNLDVTVQAQILELIRELKGEYESSVLYITHDLGVVAEVCDRVAVMYAGNVCELADVAAVFKNPLHPYTQALLASIPRPGKEFTSIEGEVPALINPPAGCRFNPRCGKATELCTREKPKLLEVEKDHFVMCHLYTGNS